MKKRVIQRFPHTWKAPAFSIYLTFRHISSSCHHDSADRPSERISHYIHSFNAKERHLVIHLWDTDQKRTEDWQTMFFRHDDEVRLLDRYRGNGTQKWLNISEPSTRTKDVKTLLYSQTMKWKRNSHLLLQGRAGQLESVKSRISRENLGNSHVFIYIRKCTVATLLNAWANKAKASPVTSRGSVVVTSVIHLQHGIIQDSPKSASIVNPEPRTL